MNGGALYDAGFIHTVTDKDKTTKSSLLIKDVSVRNSGKYTCKPSNAEEAFVIVHVVGGEYDFSISAF